MGGFSTAQVVDVDPQSVPPWTVAAYVPAAGSHCKDMTAYEDIPDLRRPCPTRFSPCLILNPSLSTPPGAVVGSSAVPESRQVR
ncbi:MAG: hypothetical protein JWN52_6228 [Actinomycetia bacterium]|nr:hypothetical protein [Actinomycetes bacterium]